MSTTGARAERTDLTPECRLSECGHCPGPCVVRLQGDAPEATPVLTVTCACTCHVGVKR